MLPRLLHKIDWSGGGQSLCAGAQGLQALIHLVQKNFDLEIIYHGPLLPFDGDSSCRNGEDFEGFYWKCVCVEEPY